jgi:hypothetical protein
VPGVRHGVRGIARLAGMRCKPLFLQEDFAGGGSFPDGKG